MAGNRFVHHPCLLYRCRDTGCPLHTLGQPVLAACRALLQFQAQLAATVGVYAVAGVDAVLGAPERTVLVLVQRLLQCLARLDQSAFWYMLGVFAVLATIHVLRSLFTFYVTQAFSIRWRVWLTERLTHDWMHGDAYYRGQFLAEPVDNPDQRIELDANAFVTNSVTLALGAVSALVSLVAFTGILWSLSAPLAVAGVEVPRAMVFAVYLYVIVATWIAFRLGRPLIRLNFLNEKLTANFRYALMRLRENAENIAFYKRLGGAWHVAGPLCLLDRQRMGAGVPEPEIQWFQLGC